MPARVLNMIAFVDREWSGEIATGCAASAATTPRACWSFLRAEARAARRAGEHRRRGRCPGPARARAARDGRRRARRAHLDDLLTIADPLMVTDLPTLLWSPHGHHEVVSELLPRPRRCWSTRSTSRPRRSARARLELKDQAYVVDLAWLRSTPWRERLATSFDPPRRRRICESIAAVTIRHHPESTVAAMLMRAGWPRAWAGSGPAHRGRRAPEPARPRGSGAVTPAPPVRAGAAGAGLEGSPSRPPPASASASTADRAACGLARARRDGEERQWTIPGASRGETGVLGEGIRQALLRDPTYVPALGAARAMVR